MMLFSLLSFFRNRLILTNFCLWNHLSNSWLPFSKKMTSFLY